MHHTQTYKKLNWTHALNPTGSRPFWFEFFGRETNSSKGLRTIAFIFAENHPQTALSTACALQVCRSKVVAAVAAAIFDSSPCNFEMLSRTQI